MDNIKFNIGLDIAYQININENLKAGVATGYSNYFTKSVAISINNGPQFDYHPSDLGIIPASFTAQYNFISPNIFLGGDIGYAFFTSKGYSSTGAFYFQPKVGSTINNNEFYISHIGMNKKNWSMGSINLGYTYIIK